MAAKLPFTIFGDIGELASNKLDPKFSFFCRVSAEISEISFMFRHSSIL
jgi:hypothetical protein